MKLNEIEHKHPKIDDEVLCLRLEDHYFVGSYEGVIESYGNKPVFQSMDSGRTYNDVTHWCALPKP